MEDKELFEIYKNSFRNIFSSSISEQELEAKVIAFFDKHKNIKTSKNSVHIQYLGGILSEAEFALFDNKLTEVELELSRFDDSGEPKASLEDFVFVFFVTLNQYVFADLYQDIKGNLKWDIIKYLIGIIHEKINGKKYNKFQGKKVEEKEITFGLKVKIDKNTQFDFSFTGLDQETLSNTLDKILPFLNEQTEASAYRLQYFVKFDKEKNSWKKLDMLKEIKRRNKLNNEINEKK